MRLARRDGEQIDRSQEIGFTFGGHPVSGFAGDTIGSALYASGRRVFSRSFKYHRPRGLLCCTGRCPNCLMTVDGVPDVRVCTEPLREGAEVKQQNVVGSLDRDLLRLTDWLGGPFTPVGFYYRTMIRPRWAWPLYERFLRNVAGLGAVDEDAERSGRFDTEHVKADVLVVGGGGAGQRAAAEARAGGEHVIVVDDQGRGDIHGTALGTYEGGLVPVDGGDVLYRVRAGGIVIATGAVEQPLVFAGNDLVGVMLPSAVRRLVSEWSLRPGQRAVVVTADDRGLEAAELLRSAGTDVVEVVDLRERQIHSLQAQGRRRRLRRVWIDAHKIRCDVLVMSGGTQPAYSLLAQAGARVEYDAARGVFLPTGLPDGVAAVGDVTGEATAQAVPDAAYGGAGKSFVCICEDVTTKDMKRAIAEGFDSIELAKRYTTVTMGPCQGKLCHLPAIRFYAKETGADEATIGTTTARPPWQPVSLGLLAGRGHEPAKRTSIHHRHQEAGARMMWTGAWRRAHSYGDEAAEVRVVHEAVGVIDVSTLGKLLVSGPDAVTFLERLYPNRFGDLRPGRIRYGVLGTDAGRIMDDGTIARLGEDAFYVTTTSTGAEAVVEWFEWWNAVWKLDVEIEDVTGALAALNVAGPRARDLLTRLTELDLSPAEFAYLDAHQAPVAGVDCLLLRIGFVGELGYEIHFPSPYGEHVWDAVLAAGADLGVRPFGLEPQRVLRLEKMHILVGQDTDSESNVLEAGMSWIAKLDKDDFVGKWALEHVRERGDRERLVGFVMESRVVAPEGGVIVVEGQVGGRVTSARWSEATDASIGMAWIRPELAYEGARIDIKLGDHTAGARVRLTPFYDPEGKVLKA